MGFNVCMMTCIHHCGIIQNSSAVLKLFCFDYSLFPPIILWTPLCLFTVSIVLSFSECHIVEIIYRMQPFRTGFFHLEITHLSFLHVFSSLVVNFSLAVNNIQLSTHTRVSVSIHLLKDILTVSKFLQL